MVVSKDYYMERLPVLPLVVKDKANGYKKTKKVILLLMKLKFWDDIKKIWQYLNKCSDNDRMQKYVEFNLGDVKLSIMKTVVSSKPSETTFISLYVM